MKKVEHFTSESALYFIQIFFPEDNRLFANSGKNPFVIELVTVHPPCMKNPKGIPFYWRLLVNEQDVYIYEQISKRAYNENTNLPFSRMNNGEKYKDEENDILYEVVGGKVHVSKNHELCGNKDSAKKALREYLIAQGFYSPQNKIMAKFWDDKLSGIRSGVLEQGIPVWYIPPSDAKKGFYILVATGEIMTVDSKELGFVKDPKLGDEYETSNRIIVFYNGDFHVH